MTEKLFATYDAILIEAELEYRGGSGKLALMSSKAFEKQLDTLGISVQQFTEYVAERAEADRTERLRKRELDKARENKNKNKKSGITIAPKYWGK